MKCTLYALYVNVSAAALAQAFVAVPRNCYRLLVDASLHNIIIRNTTSSSVYQQEVQSYWSVTARLEHDCFVQPENTEQVSCIFKTLNDESRCQFAVRSGGNSSICGWNNIYNGVTINLSRLNFTLFDEGSNLLSGGPGVHW
ncbi:hypothetical protein E8E12_000079 [Didymella heteroderae]|uniref:Secreted protein n=1 Tax=Didymella heteroderae TaxID=1769908 RepID=A0A9P4WF53_9PLEO|nr:hypothetical protein E8E12_000079 [Didymella heteroderae]